MPNDNRCWGKQKRTLYFAAECATLIGGTYACGQYEEKLLRIVIAVIMALVVAGLRVPDLSALPPPGSDESSMGPCTLLTLLTKNKQSAPTKQADPEMEAMEARFNKINKLTEKKIAVLERQLAMSKKEIDAGKKNIVVHERQLAMGKKEIDVLKKDVSEHNKRITNIESAFDIRETARIVESLLLQVINSVLTVTYIIGSEKRLSTFSTLKRFMDEYKATSSRSDVREAVDGSPRKWLAKIESIHLFLQCCKHAGNAFAHGGRPCDVRILWQSERMGAVPETTFYNDVNIAWPHKASEAVEHLAQEASKHSGLTSKESKGFAAWLRAQSQAINDAAEERRKQFAETARTLHGTVR